MSTINPPPMRDMLEIAQDEMIMKDRIAACLKEDPKTIQELAEELDYPTREITIWLFGMRRYNEIEEVGRPDIDGYFKYEIKEQEGDPSHG